jgi:hypothetical protein
MWFESIEFLKISWVDLEVSLERATLKIGRWYLRTEVLYKLQAAKLVSKFSA